MKIEKNMYVRTIFGIAKIININDYREPDFKYGLEANYLKDIVFIGDKDILKASYNIIDLIEKGDYVNGDLVYKSYTGNLFTLYNYVGGKGFQTIETYQTSVDDAEFINSIVTHEQFENMKYEVE